MVHYVLGEGEGVQHVVVIADSKVVLVVVVVIVQSHVRLVVVVLGKVSVVLHAIQHVVGVGALSAVVEQEDEGVAGVLVVLQAVIHELVDSGQEPSIGHHLQREEGRGLSVITDRKITLNHYSR